MTDTLLEIWNKILTSNLFNFVLMLILLGWIIDKFKLGDVLEAGRKSIEDKIVSKIVLMLLKSYLKLRKMALK